MVVVKVIMMMEEGESEKFPNKKNFFVPFLSFPFLCVWLRDL